MIPTQALPLTAAWLQDADMGNVIISNKLFMIFLVVVTVSVVIQCVALLVMAVVAVKTRTNALRIATDLQAKANPLLDMSRKIMEDTQPKLRVITSNVTEASFVLLDQAQRIDQTMRSTLDRVDEQVEHADQLVTATLNGVETATHSLQHAIMVPVKQAAAIVAGLKAMIARLTSEKNRTGASKGTRKGGDLYDS